MEHDRSAHEQRPLGGRVVKKILDDVARRHFPGKTREIRKASRRIASILKNHSPIEQLEILSGALEKLDGDTVQATDSRT